MMDRVYVIIGVSSHISAYLVEGGIVYHKSRLQNILTPSPFLVLDRKCILSQYLREVLLGNDYFGLMGWMYFIA